MDQIFISEISRAKILNIKNKNCPNCGHHILQRIKRKNRHKLLAVLFGGPNLKRFNCIKCEWKGLKWDPTNSIGSN